MRFDLAFLTIAAACMVCGVCLGIYMGVAQNFLFTPVHAHLNLLGWVSLALYGLTYRAYPSLQRGWLAGAHLITSSAGSILFPLSLALVLTEHSVWLAFAASSFVLAGALIFLGRCAALWFKPGASDP